MKNLPEHIYLNFGPIDEDEDFAALREVTWCTDKINETDAEYVRADLMDTIIDQAFEYAAENARMIPNGLSEDVNHWIDRDHMKSLADEFKKEKL